MFETALKQMWLLSWKSSEHIAKNLAGIHLCESGQRGDRTGREQNAPIHDCLAVMTGRSIGPEPSYLDPLIRISNRTRFHKMARRLLRMMPLALTCKNGDLYSPDRLHVAYR